MSDASVSTGKKLAKAAKCTDTKPEAYVKCLRQLSTKDLQAVYNAMNLTDPFYDVWSIRVDGDLYTQSTMKELDTKRPAMIGLNSMETPVPNGMGISRRPQCLTISNSAFLATLVPAANFILNYTLSFAITDNDTALKDVLTQTARYVYIDSKGDRNDLQFVYEQATKV